MIGGPIANSDWMYFCGKFDTPAAMDAWYLSPQHKPAMDMAYKSWFDAYYIRKWRLPADEEPLDGPLFLEISIVPERELHDAAVDHVVQHLTDTLPRYNVSAFETLPGQFEPQPFQFVGPLEEFPEVAPVRYLLLTHWGAEKDLVAWLESEDFEEITDLGGVFHQIQVQIRHEPGEREYLNPDGTLRGWSRHGTPA